MELQRLGQSDHRLPKTVPVVYIDRLDTDIRLSDVEYVTRARYAWYGNCGMVLDIMDLDGIRAYKVLV